MRNSRAGLPGNGAAQGAETVARLSHLFRGHLFLLVDVEALVCPVLCPRPLNVQQSPVPAAFQPGGGGYLKGSDVSAAADMRLHHPIT